MGTAEPCESSKLMGMVSLVSLAAGIVSAMIRRTPVPELLPFVSRLWAADDHAAHGERERVLPIGAMHVVIRLDHPLRVFTWRTSRPTRCSAVTTRS